MDISLDAEATVLLVEDEVRTRDALVRELQRRRYLVLIAKSCREAVQLLSSTRPDAMVLDLGLPDTDGSILFRMLRERNVMIPTVVYTGRVLPQGVYEELRAGGARILTKGGSIEPLFRGLEELLGGRWTPLGSDAPPTGGAAPSFEVALSRRLERNAISDSDIPVLDARVGQLQAFVQDPSAPVEPILEIVGNDPRLAAAVLEQVNSAFYGSANSVTNVRRACIQLGAKRVAALATQVIARGTFRATRKPFQFIMQELWVESIVAARMASRLAELSDLKNADELYTLGLLHNIGELLIVDLAGRLPHTVGDEEVLALHRQLERSHERLGRVLMSKWELPGVIQNLTGAHHRIAEGDTSWEARLRVLVLASFELATQTVKLRPPVDRPLSDRFRQLGLSPDLIAPLLAEASDWPTSLRRTA